MAEDGKPAVIETAVRSWREALQAVVATPVAAVVALACTTVLSIAGLWIMEAMVPPGGVRFADLWLGVRLNLVSAAVVALQYVLVAPLAIAVHRHVLLGQVTRGYPVSPSNARFLRYASYAVLVSVLISLPAIVYALIVPLLPGTDPMWAMLATFIVVGTLIVRRVVVFPAVAVDAADAGWQQARLLAQGHSWWVFFTLVCAALPFALLMVPLYFLQTWSATADWIGVLVFRLAAGSIWVLMICVLASAASQLYRALDPLLGQPAVPAPTIRTG